MNFISPELTIHVLKNMETNHRCLYFQFKGKFTTETSIAGSKAWGEFMDENPNDSCEFVWDCQEMDGFELSARKEWYKAMQEYKDRIAIVYVISNHVMIRSAARVMLHFFKIPSQINRTEDQLPEAIRL